MDGIAPGNAALRRGRISEPGRVYLVTTVTHDREPLFTKLRKARHLAATLRSSDERGHSWTLCYVVMPDHLHWLFELAGTRSLSATVGALKALSARRIGHPVWQPGFHDHAVRRDEDLRTLARYVVGNPLRAGLVDSIGDYPFWDAVWL